MTIGVATNFASGRASARTSAQLDEMAAWCAGA